MKPHPIVPCIWLDNQAERVARFYTQTFNNGHIAAVSHYPESFENPVGKPPGSVLTVEFEIAGQRFTALNGGPQFVVNPSISFFVHTESATETDRLFATLQDGGKVLMPVDTYPWSERYGWVQDRSGASWQIMSGRREEQTSVIAPCFMFAGAVHGRAEEAIQLYTSIFGGKTLRMERYAAGEGAEGTLKHGRFTLGGQDFVAMDSHLDHGFSFNEGLSLQIMCESQAELDHFWNELSAGGAQGPCGWLKDRFGVSWQVVPRGIVQWMTSKNTTASDRCFQAMLDMKKLDIAKLEAAFKAA